MAIPFYAGIALGQIGRRWERRYGHCAPIEEVVFVKSKKQNKAEKE